MIKNVRLITFMINNANYSKTSQSVFRRKFIKRYFHFVTSYNWHRKAFVYFKNRFWFVYTYIYIWYIIASGFWLGGTDIQNEGDWIWTSSQTVVTFDDWTVDAPNNRFGNEHCLAIRKLNGFQWNDDDCSSSFRFICEKVSFFFFVNEHN